MKEQYIRQVEKELNLSRKAKTEVVRDLNEIFNSAVEHGETEQQVIERLGTPQEFANSTAEQFGIDNSVPKKRKWIISSVISLVVAIVAFLIYATAKSGKVPEGAIGQADAMTNIQVNGDFIFDASQIILLVGIIAFAFATIQIIRAVHNNRRVTMKRFIPGIAILLILSLTACSAPKTPPKDTGDASNSQSEGIIRLDEGEWPVNEYTEGLPVPTGTVAWAMLDTEHGNFSISIAGIDEKGYDNYMELLIQEGFSVVENVSEKIKGENYVSVGTLLSNGEKGLSISYIPDNLTIYVSFEK